MPESACLEPRCPRFAVYRGRCQQHSAEDQGRQHISFYDRKRWKILRRRKLFITPLCEQCGEIATDVHHKQGRDRAPWDIHELESLCHSCHSRETRAEQLAGHPQSRGKGRVG